ncbi:uncharacterized protein LOC119078822 isoform X1 [Bradysia coprophila]|uniref:uncharacterized protein LOC119078822 isoform X1 n=1 Tax=Bradysia coprophila TaxID=38358 RepID=UPI00187D8571|nr:uncharacterized protein LOC119078822 isoform X1 [Bradysia coprophila]
MIPEKRIFITHCVDPHHFYFKYVDDCVNNEYSKFDYALQCYGNDLHDRQLTTYHPDKNELITFFDVISNKWLRGRVTNVNGDNITLWCIDNGILRKTEAEFIQPLTENLKKDFNLVQLGGVSVLPAVSTLDFETLIVKMQVKHSWDKDMSNTFKSVIDSAKRINFIEEIDLDQHKFGTLSTETWKDKVVVINEILLQLNKGIPCGGSSGMTTYMCEKRMKEEFHQSLEMITTLSRSINSRRTSIASEKFDFDMITNPFKSETAHDVSERVDSIPKGTLQLNVESKVEAQKNPSKPTETSGASGKDDVVERHSKPVIPEDTSNKSKLDSLKPRKPATDKSVGKLADLKAAKSNGTSSTSKFEMENPFKSKKTSGASGVSDGIELFLEPAKPTGTTSASNQAEMRLEASVSVKCDWEPIKPVRAARKFNNSKTEEENPFKPKVTSDTSGKSGEAQSVKPKATALTSEIKINENPFKPKKPSTESVKCDQEHDTSSGATSESHKTETVCENPQSNKTSDALGKSCGIESVLESTKPNGAEGVSDQSEMKMEENPFKRKKGPSGKCGGIELHLKPVQHKEAASITDQPEKEMENPFKPKKTSVLSSKCEGTELQHSESVKPMETSAVSGKSGEAETDFEFVKTKRTAASKSNESKTELDPEQNPFKPTKISGAPGTASDGTELLLEPVKPKRTTSLNRFKTDESPFKLQQKKHSSEFVQSDGIESGPAKRERTSNTLEKSEMKLDEYSFKSNRYGKPESDVQGENSHESKKIDHSSLQNGFGSIESIDKTGVSFVYNSEKNKADLPSLDGSFDTLNSVSMAVSTIRTFISEAKTHRNNENTKSLHIDYDCHLKTLKFGNGETIRGVQQSSIGWVNKQRFPVDDDNESCSSSIINLMDDKSDITHVK